MFQIEFEEKTKLNHKSSNITADVSAKKNCSIDFLVFVNFV
jgi:hypothetical protein